MTGSREARERPGSFLARSSRDVVQTITIDPTLESALTLGVVALVRTFLCFCLENELEGVVSWRRSAAQTDRGSVRPSGSG